MLDVKRLLRDFNILFVESGKDWQPGWINIKCPKCTDPEYHGGFNINGGYYNCWRCGHHKNYKIISELLSLDYKKAIEILNSYGSVWNVEDTERKKGTAVNTELPFGCGPLKSIHKNYLKLRNFDPKKIEKKWNIQGTGRNGDYKFRIIAPILFNGRLVSYQGRDVSGLQELRYKAAKIENEVMHHKHILYGIDHIKNRRAVIVEGITDVWRLGYGAIATFGTGFTLDQMLVISQRVDYAAILFDTGEEAKENARKMNMYLQMLGTQVEEYEIDGDYEDPAELPDKEARHFMKSIL